MIHNFSFENFYSFKNPSHIDFAISEKAPKNNFSALSSSGTRLSKILDVLGPNASGKTNLLKVVPFLKHLVVFAWEDQPNDPILVKPFLFETDNNKPINLSITFEIASGIYNYAFSLTPVRILSEKLSIRNKSAKKITTKILFERDWDTKIGKYYLKKDKCGLRKISKEFERSLRTNASVISTAFRSNHPLSQEIYDFFNKIQTNVTEIGYTSNSNWKSLSKALYFFENNLKLKREAVELLTRFDLGLNDLNVKFETRENKVHVQEALGLHLVEGKEYKLPVEYESSGTQRLIIILRSILQVLTEGGVAVIDELDSNLHPDMIMPLLQLFISPDLNKLNSQLIFSGHQHIILSELDKYQIQIVEKNKEGQSETWRLDQLKNLKNTKVRADDNYYSKYITGAYGGVPNIE